MPILQLNSESTNNYNSWCQNTGITANCSGIMTLRTDIKQVSCERAWLKNLDWNFELTPWLWSWHVFVLFLGGLSLHLNHLIAQRLAICDRPFGTFLIGIFLSNLDTWHLETYPRTYYGHFWNMSIFDGSRAIRVIFRKWVPSENQRYLKNGWPRPPFWDLTWGGQMTGLQDRLIFSGLRHT